MPPETPNPNATEHERKEKKKFNFFFRKLGFHTRAGGDSPTGSRTSRVRRTRKLHFVGPPPELPPESQVSIQPSGK
jgi:hypothetical protein